MPTSLNLLFPYRQLHQAIQQQKQAGCSILAAGLAKMGSLVEDVYVLLVYLGNVLTSKEKGVNRYLRFNENCDWIYLENLLKQIRRKKLKTEVYHVSTKI